MPSWVVSSKSCFTFKLVSSLKPLQVLVGYIDAELSTRLMGLRLPKVSNLSTPGAQKQGGGPVGPDVGIKSSPMFFQILTQK